METPDLQQSCVSPVFCAVRAWAHRALMRGRETGGTDRCERGCLLDVVWSSRGERLAPEILLA